MIKAEIYNLEGKKVREINLPDIFRKGVRIDILSKVLEVKKTEHPFGPKSVAGKQHSASGILIHRRHVWKSQYGRGISRIPRKIHSNRGSQFIWEGSTVPQTRGGRRAHPPKPISRMISPKINKKEMRIAFESALSATASEKYLRERYSSLQNKEIKNIPLIIDKIKNMKTKELIEGLKKILGRDLTSIAFKMKKIRAGKGKMRGRKYKKNAGLLLVIGKDEKIKTKAIDIKEANSLNVVDLARGGPGRLTIYTESAIKDLEERLK